jgi:hypothetical protein
VCTIVGFKGEALGLFTSGISAQLLAQKWMRNNIFLIFLFLAKLKEMGGGRNIMNLIKFFSKILDRFCVHKFLFRQSLHLYKT